MECKFVSVFTAFNWFSRINRYIMECKYSGKGVQQWNLRELIDTLWNVNKRPNIQSTGSKERINRYIMECKYT